MGICWQNCTTRGINFGESFPSTTTTTTTTSCYITLAKASLELPARQGLSGIKRNAAVVTSRAYKQVEHGRVLIPCQPKTQERQLDFWGTLLRHVLVSENLEESTATVLDNSWMPRNQPVHPKRASIVKPKQTFLANHTRLQELVIWSIFSANIFLDRHQIPMNPGMQWQRKGIFLENMDFDWKYWK